MNPEEYEHHVADVLRAEGWTASVTRLSRDLGVDVLATRGDKRLAVQAMGRGKALRLRSVAEVEG